MRIGIEEYILVWVTVDVQSICDTEGTLGEYHN